MNWNVDIRLQLGALTLGVQFDNLPGVVAVIGPNGSGKTSLLRCLTGALRPSHGQIKVGDSLLFDAAQGISLPPEARRIGYVPQGYALFPHLNAVDNVAFGLLAHGSKSGLMAHRAQALEHLCRMDCAHLADRKPSALSAGEKQRVALARALAIEPNMLLLDEPLSALDAMARRQTRHFLSQQLGSLDTPTILVTHDVRDVIALDAYVVVLVEGKIIAQGTVEEVGHAPTHVFIEEFFYRG